jgi:hypothetical protein
MANCQITHIRKHDRFSEHDHITHAGNPPNWFWTREDIITSIQSKSNTFYVKDSISGKRSEVGVVYPGDGRSPFLRTHADGNWNDNLLSLPMY